MKSPEISEEDIDRIIKAHGIKPDFDFHKALISAGRLYEILSTVTWDPGEQRVHTKKLHSASKALIKAIDAFEVSIAHFETVSRNPTKERLPVLMRNTDVERTRVRFNAEIWAEASENILQCPEKVFGKPKQGRENHAFNSLIDLLIDIYCQGTGRKLAKPSSDPNSGKRGGPMFRFIEHCIELLTDERKSNTALGSAIDRVYRKKAR
jgi:hypothetical protein